MTGTAGGRNILHHQQAIALVIQLAQGIATSMAHHRRIESRFRIGFGVLGIRLVGVILRLGGLMKLLG